MATIETLERKAAAAAQDRDAAIRQRQEAEDQLQKIIGRIAKAKPEGREDLIAGYAKARDTVEALTEATDLLSTGADDAQIAIAQAELDQAVAAAEKAGQARKEHGQKLNAHIDEMRRLHNGSHPKQQELTGDDLDEWREQMVTTEAILKERARPLRRENNRAARRRGAAEKALEELKEELGVDRS